MNYGILFCIIVNVYTQVLNVGGKYGIILIVMPHGIFRVITVKHFIKFFKTIWHQHELKKFTSKNLSHLKLDAF